MKIDLLGKKWLDIVFEGRNKSYGAYDLRKHNSSTNLVLLPTTTSTSSSTVVRLSTSS